MENKDIINWIKDAKHSELEYVLRELDQRTSELLLDKLLEYINVNERILSTVLEGLSKSKERYVFESITNDGSDLDEFITASEIFEVMGWEITTEVSNHYPLIEFDIDTTTTEEFTGLLERVVDNASGLIMNKDKAIELMNDLANL